MKKMVLFVFCLLITNSIVINISANEISHNSEYISQIINDLNISEDSIIERDNAPMNSIEVNNNDGTKTLYLFNKDIKYIDDSGEVVNKDLTVVTTNDKDKLQDGFITNVKANDIDTSYPIKLSDNGIKIDNVELVPCNSNAIISSRSISSVYYSEVFKGIDLTCEPQLEGFSGKFDLENINDINKINFEIQSKVPYEVESKDGEVIIHLENDEIYKISANNIEDESGKLVGDSYFELNGDNLVSMTYTSIENVSTEENVTTSLLMEKVISQAAPISEITVFSDENPGVEEGYNYIGTDEDGTIARTFIKFNLEDIENIDYDRILSAYYSNTLYEYGTKDISEIYFVKDEWNENYINWVSMPQIGKKIYGHTNALSMLEENFKSRKYYITSAVQAWLQGVDNNGIIIKCRNDEGWCKMSKGGNTLTYLAITYSEYDDTPKTKGVEHGDSYYILNKNSKQALTTSFISSDGTIIQDSFKMANEQKWHLIHKTTIDGINYYAIKINGTNYYLSVNTTYDKYNILLKHCDLENDETAYIDDTMLWRFVRNWDGSYKIIPKNNNTKALNVYNGSFLTKTNVCLTEATVDFEYDDDWTLIPMYNNYASLYGLKSKGGLLTFEEVEKVKNNLMYSGYSCSKYINTSASDFIDDLFKTQICYFSSHGNLSRMYFYSDFVSDTNNGNTAIGLHNGTEFDEFDEGESVTVYGIKDYNGNMNKLQLCFMNSCSTGSNYGNESLVGAMYEEGAHCLVSFTRTLDHRVSQEWYGYFNLMLYKSDVETSMLFADRMLEDKYTSVENSLGRHVLGDTSIFYNYNAIANISDLSEYSTTSINEADLLDDTIYNAETNEGSSNEIEVYKPDSDNYYTDTDVEGNIYGYLNDTDELAFYVYNRRNTNFSGDYVYMNGALYACSNFLNELNLSIGDFDFETSNEYSSEFIVKLNSENTENTGGIVKITLFVEIDHSGEYQVTFCDITR